MNELSDQYPVKTIAEALDVSRTGHYRDHTHGPRALKDQELIVRIKDIYE